MTTLLQRRAKAEKEGMIMIKMIRIIMERLLNTREKEELIMINLIRNLNIGGMTLPLKVNQLMKMKNVLEGVMILLIWTLQGHRTQSTEAEWMMRDQVKGDNDMTLSKAYS